MTAIGVGIGAGFLRGGAAAVTLADASSLGFAKANATYDTANYSFVTAASLDTASSPLFDGAGALVVEFEVPWHSHGRTADEYLHILSNHNGVSGANSGGKMLLYAKVPANYAAAPELVFSINNGTTWVHAVCTLGDRLTGRFLMRAETDASGEMTVAFYHDGASIGSVAYTGAEQTLAGISLTGDQVYLGRPTGIVSTGIGFCGSIGFVGYYDGAVGNTAAAALSAGASFETTLTAANWRFARALAARTGPVAAESWASGDTLPAWTRTTVGAWRHGSDLRPARDGSGNTFALDGIVDGTVWGVAPGETSVAVPLSGTSSGLTGAIEYRVLYWDGQVHTGWTEIAGSDLTGGGAWSEAPVISIASRGWCVVEVRPQDAPEMVQRSRAFCGVGHVIAFVGQSTISYTFKTGSSRVPVSPGNFSFAITDKAQGRVVERATTERAWTYGLARMAEVVGQWTSAPVMLFDMTYTGIGPGGLQNDADTARDWTTEVGGLISIVGNRVSAFAIEWSVAYAESATQEAFAALVSGDDSGVAWTVSDQNFMHGTDFFHTTAAGIGIIYDGGWQGLANGATDHSEWWDYGSGLGNNMKARNRIHRALALRDGYTVGPGNGTYEINGGHAETQQAQERLSEAMMLTGLRTVGLFTLEDPSVAGLTANAGLDEVTIGFTLPNGGSLQTEWSFDPDGTGGPGVGINPVQGIEWADPADATAHPDNITRSGFATALSGNTVVATKDSGAWSPGTIFYVNHELLANYGSATPDGELWFGTLFESHPKVRGGLGMSVIDKPGYAQIPFSPSDDLSALVEVDPSDTSQANMIQERDGDFDNGTPCAAGDPVGSIRNKGSLGGYFYALTDAARPTLRALSWTVDELEAGVARTGEVAAGYLDYDGSDDRMRFSEGAGIPLSGDFAVGYAFRSTGNDTRRTMWGQMADASSTNAIQHLCNAGLAFQYVANDNRMWWDGMTNTGGGAGINQTAHLSALPTAEHYCIFNVNAGSEGVKWLADRLTQVDSCTRPAAVNDGILWLGCPTLALNNPWLNYKGRLYGFAVFPDALDATGQRQVAGWLGRRCGLAPPWW